ncbi:MAG: HEPN domain-containing protein [Deltaproteobacteria bacterium]|nr:HEPN domain-containing protein [Deltaproteobacteria bacterium]
MSPEFNKCLRKGKIRPFSKEKNLFSKELKIAGEDLENAKDSYKSKKFKWATIQAYFCMFHAARALIYFQGYRERSHYCLIVALRTLFVSKRLLDYRLVEILLQGKRLRENADYYDEWSQESANQMIKSAQDFIKRAKKILK